jgi:hypothetical protein
MESTIVLVLLFLAVVVAPLTLFAAYFWAVRHVTQSSPKVQRFQQIQRHYLSKLQNKLNTSYSTHAKVKSHKAVKSWKFDKQYSEWLSSHRADLDSLAGQHEANSRLHETVEQGFEKASKLPYAFAEGERFSKLERRLVRKAQELPMWPSVVKVALHVNYRSPSGKASSSDSERREYSIVKHATALAEHRATSIETVAPPEVSPTKQSSTQKSTLFASPAQSKAASARPVKTPDALASRYRYSEPNHLARYEHIPAPTRRSSHV